LFVSLVPKKLYKGQLLYSVPVPIIHYLLRSQELIL